jgi:CheY-like chemotaxis protein/two-component sensor histidine kinase
MQSLARSIEASLNAVEEIMSALLDMSRIDSGAFKPAPAPFQIRDLIQKVAVEFAPLAHEKSIELRLVDSNAVANADRALVARIVQNLVSNAIKYTRPGGHVLVGCRRRGARIRLDVVDTGIGFSRDQHRLLFAEFSRLDQGARMAQGLGLGLSIVERLVVAMNLTLELDSVEGRGSRFSLYLPRGKIERVAAVESERTVEAMSLAGLKILCVDNERAVLDAMEGLLRGWGCDVRSARSLRDIDRDQLLSGWLPDLVLMDYHLDQTSGLDAVEWLRHNVGGHLPAALVTADRTPAVRALAEERGIAVVTKPVKPAALRAVIGGLAAQRGQKASRKS